MTTNVQTQTGNRLVVEFNNIKIGLLQSLRATDDYGMEPATTVGDIHVQEYVPTRASHRLSVSRMVLITQSLRSAGIATVNGDDALKGTVFNICEYSRDSGALLRTYVSCSWASGDVEVSANRIVMESGSIVALDVQGTGL